MSEQNSISVSVVNLLGRRAFPDLQKCLNAWHISVDIEMDKKEANMIPLVVSGAGVILKSWNISGIFYVFCN